MSVPKRKQLSKATRLEVLNKYDNHCAYCGCELTYEQLNVDHKIPLYYAEFGYDINYLESMDNYMPSCRSCNKYKTTYTIETFRKMIEKQPDILNRDSSTYRLATKFGVVTPTPHKVKFYFEKVEENLLTYKLLFEKNYFQKITTNSFYIKEIIIYNGSEKINRRM